MGVNGNGFLTKMDLKKGPPEYFEGRGGVAGVVFIQLLVVGGDTLGGGCGHDREGVLAEVGEDIARPARDDGSAACRGF